MNYLLFFLATLLFYGSSLKYGFSQDDFFFLKLAQAHNLKEILLFFSFFHQQGFPFYRPLGTQFYFFIFRSLFGLEKAPLFMHIFMLLIQALNGYLVFKIAQKFNFSLFKSLILGLLYSTAALHFLSLFYIAATQQLLAATFSLLTILAFLNQKPLSQAIWFILALLSKETAVTIVPILALISFYQSRPLKNTLKALLPTTSILLLYILLRFSAGIQVQSEYHLSLNLQAISTLRWYLLFSFGLPELLLNYGEPRGAINFLQFFHDYHALAIFSVVPGIIALLLFIFKLFKYRIPNTRYWLLTIWWVVGILLVLFFPNHRYPHYLDLSFVGLLLLFFLTIKKKLFYLISFLLILNSAFSIALSQQTHWTTNRALMAQKVWRILQTEDFCLQNPLYITGPNNLPLELSYTLSLENGPQVLCNNFHLKVYYQGVNLKEPIPPGAKVLSLTPEILNHD